MAWCKGTKHAKCKLMFSRSVFVCFLSRSHHIALILYCMQYLLGKSQCGRCAFYSYLKIDFVVCFSLGIIGQILSRYGTEQNQQPRSNESRRGFHALFAIRHFPINTIWLATCRSIQDSSVSIVQSAGGASMRKVTSIATWTNMKGRLFLVTIVPWDILLNLLWRSTWKMFMGNRD